LLEQNEEIQVKKDSDQAIGGNWSTSVGGQATVDANGLNGTIVLNATTNISLTVGSSSIVITPAAIAITAPMVLLNSSGPSPATPIDPQVDAPQEPMAADPGDTLTPSDHVAGPDRHWPPELYGTTRRGDPRVPGRRRRVRDRPREDYDCCRRYALRDRCRR
jgi:hypothetical protein